MHEITPLTNSANESLTHFFLTKNNSARNILGSYGNECVDTKEIKSPSIPK
jgi:hypothetical protein